MSLEALRAAIAAGDAAAAEVHAAALTLVGRQVIITSYDIGGAQFEQSGVLLRVERWAQYPWSLVIRPPRVRCYGLRYWPGKVLAIRPADGKEGP